MLSRFGLGSMLALTALASSLHIDPRDASKNPSASPSPEVKLTDSNQPDFSFDELYSLQKTIWNNFLFPANEVQAKAINSTLFAEDVQGRVDVTRTFSGRELNTEYIFGLFASIATNPSSITLLGLPLSYEITKFVAKQNIASASTRFTFNFTAVGIILPVTIDSWIVWNAEKQVSEYDATFKWWQWTVDEVLQQAAVKYGINSATETIEVVTKALVSSICTTASTYCTGPDQQYNSSADCADFLTNKIRFGEAYEGGRNTLLCRMVHQGLVPYRPGVHCPHIGPTGGGYCNDDKTYEQTVEEAYFTNAPFLPSGCT